MNTLLELLNRISTPSMAILFALFFLFSAVKLEERREGWRWLWLVIIGVWIFLGFVGATVPACQACVSLAVSRKLTSKA